MELIVIRLPSSSSLHLLQHLNALYSVMLECKFAQGKSDAFVRDVMAAHQSLWLSYFMIGILMTLRGYT